MMSDLSKWVTSITAEMPAAHAAILVLRPRLEMVSHYLPLVLEGPDQDLEAVHQLRVATRRGGAALKLFREVLPKKWFKATRNTLRSVRQAAGEARDWDVFLTWVLQKQEGVEPSAAEQLLVGFALGHRVAAQTHLTEQAVALQLDLADTLRTMPEIEELNLGGPTVAELSQLELAGFLSDFSAALGRPLQQAEELHQLRILGKRVRYAIEVFADSSSPRLREELYPHFEELQETLGTVQDGAVRQSRLTDLHNWLKARYAASVKAASAELQALSKACAAESARSRKRFKIWQARWQKAFAVENWSDWLKNESDQMPLPEPEAGAGGGNGSSSRPEESPESRSGATTRPPRRPVGKSVRSRGKTSGSSRSRESGRSG